MSTPSSISFRSGISIPEPLARLNRVLSEEYEYYDAIADASPSEILPLDVLIATGINAFIGNASATRIRKVHRGIATHCNSLLAALPLSSDIASMTNLSPIVDIIAAACPVDTVLSAVASKVLHRKRRAAIPVIDSVMAAHCCSKRLANVLAASDVPTHKLKSTLQTFLEVVQADIQGTQSELAALQGAIANTGWPLTPLRIHDLLVWTETGACRLLPQVTFAVGYHRKPVLASDRAWLLCGDTRAEPDHDRLRIPYPFSSSQVFHGR